MVRIIISRMDGVSSVDPNPVSQSAEITFDDTKVTPDKMISELKKNGFQVIGTPEYKK